MKPHRIDTHATLAGRLWSNGSIPSCVTRKSNEEMVFHEV